jgi:acyl carrier protein
MSSEVLSSVVQRLHAYLPIKISPALIVEDADLQNDLGLDSLGLASVATDLHASLAFDLQYFAENLGEIRLVGDLVRVLKEAMGNIQK